METLELLLPVEAPINQSNLFGTPSPMYAAMGIKGHEGLDFEAPLDTALFAPCSGDAFYTKDVDGGDGIWIRWPNAKAPQYNIILWHLPPASDPKYHPMIQISDTDPVTPVSAGQQLGFTGNSGYPLESSGPHLHLGVMPCKPDGSALYPSNGFHGCVDPMPFLSKIAPQDFQATQEVVSTAAQIIPEVAASNLPTATKLSFYEKVAQFLQSLFK